MNLVNGIPSRAEACLACRWISSSSRSVVFTQKSVTYLPTHQKKFEQKITKSHLVLSILLILPFGLKFLGIKYNATVRAIDGAGHSCKTGAAPRTRTCKAAAGDRRGL